MILGVANPANPVQVCSSSSECSSVMCHENFFNADGDDNNGCEATCAVLLQATQLVV